MRRCLVWVLARATLALRSTISVNCQRQIKLLIQGTCAPEILRITLNHLRFYILLQREYFPVNVANKIEHATRRPVIYHASEWFLKSYYITGYELFNLSHLYSKIIAISVMQRYIYNWVSKFLFFYCGIF